MCDLQNSLYSDTGRQASAINLLGPLRSRGALPEGGETPPDQSLTLADYPTRDNYRNWSVWDAGEVL